jgi:hypothetical protein
MTRIKHRELVSSVSGNTTFGVASFNLNPGLSATFPWLSSVAGSFEQYKFNKLVFHYVTRASTSYKGSILLAPEYDAIDAPPSSEVLASQMNGAVEDSPWKDQTLSFNIGDMFPMGPRKYIRTGTLPTSSDLKTYDAGQLFACSISCDDTSAIGKLWVEYDVELHIPQNPGAAALYNVGSMALFDITGSSQSVATGVAEDIVWDNERTNDIGAVNASGVFTLPIGKYYASGAVYINTSSAASLKGEVIPYIDSVAVTSSKFETELTQVSSGIPFGCIVDLSASGTFKLTIEVTGSGTLVVNDKSTYVSILRIG